MGESHLMAYRLLIVPGGNFIAIGDIRVFDGVTEAAVDREFSSPLSAIQAFNMLLDQRDAQDRFRRLG